MRRTIVGAALAAIVFITPAVAGASSITFTGSDASGLAASATFDVVGSNLVITLTNIGIDPAVPSDVLTGLFFDVAGNPALLAGSAVLGSGSFVTNGGTTDAGGSVGGEWAYKSSADFAYGASYGVSSVGLGLFGPSDLFGGTNLAGTVSPGSDDYGITSAADSTANDNPKIAGLALINDSVVLTLTGLPGGFNPLSSISNVTFQYGSDLTDTHVGGESPDPVPEPTTLVLLGTGMAVSAFRARKAKKGTK